MYTGNDIDEIEAGLQDKVIAPSNVVHSTESCGSATHVQKTLQLVNDAATLLH